MESTYYIDLYMKGKLKERHSFTLQVCGKGWYRAITSFDCFGQRQAQEYYDLMMKHGCSKADELMPYRGRTRTWIDVEFDINFDRFGYQEDVQYFHHTSIWSLYGIIGYDYKKKKWTRK